MMNNETWLMHADLPTKTWVVEQQPWVRSLGWFTEFQRAAQVEGGWCLLGPQKFELSDYISIISPIDSEKRLYCFKDGEWIHVNGPVLFIYKKNETESFVVGWAGPKALIASLKKKYETHWDWPNIFIVEVIPEVAKVMSSISEPEKYPVFFMSNGETNADVNWQTLKMQVPYAVRVDGIHGRRAAFLECARLAGTADRFFVVTGKNRVTRPEIFSYRPNDTVGSKHVVFHAKNASNDLEYGHMAIGLYNTNTVKSTPKDFGLDFTEYGGIVTVPIVASVAEFATSPYEAWRTAFRETVKIIRAKSPHLERWLHFAYGPNSEWVLQGAKDALDFMTYHVSQDPDLIFKTVEWEWLEEYFKIKDGIATT